MASPRLELTDLDKQALHRVVRAANERVASLERKVASLSSTISLLTKNAIHSESILRAREEDNRHYKEVIHGLYEFIDDLRDQLQVVGEPDSCDGGEEDEDVGGLAWPLATSQECPVPSVEEQYACYMAHRIVFQYEPSHSIPSLVGGDVSVSDDTVHTAKDAEIDRIPSPSPSPASRKHDGNPGEQTDTTTGQQKPARRPRSLLVQPRRWVRGGHSRPPVSSITTPNAVLASRPPSTQAFPMAIESDPPESPQTLAQRSRPIHVPSPARLHAHKRGLQLLPAGLKARGGSCGQCRVVTGKCTTCLRQDECSRRLSRKSTRAQRLPFAAVQQQQPEAMDKAP